MNKLAIGLLGLLVLGCSGSAPQELTGNSSDAIQVCAKGATVQGIDVSYYQGSIDFGKVKASGRDFAIARTSDGSYNDPDFGTYYADIKAAGMIRGSYHFFRASEDPITQANLVLSKIGKLGDGDLPPVLDVEVTDGQSNATVAAGVVAWVDHVAKAIGRKPIVYTAPYFWGSIGAPAVNAELWVANWQVSCPNMPSGYSDWTFWQDADNGSIPGIGGAVDTDVFNGSLAALQAFARPPDVAPRGYLDVADCTHIAGWAQDTDTPDQAIFVDFYFDGPAGDPKAQGLRVTAGNSRPDLCTAIGSCSHAYDFPPPLSLLDGALHPVFAYGIDSSGNGDNPLLGKGSFQCATPAPPVDAPHGIKRWVTGPDSFTAWKFSYLTEVSHQPDALLAAYPKGPDMPATPTVVQADDGTPEVWVVDGTTRRHVINPDSLSAWAFTVEKWAAAKVYAVPKGLDWRATPFLAEGSGPEVYFLDDAVAAPPAPPHGPTPPGSDAGPPNGDTSSSTSDSGGGCNVRGSSPTQGAWILALAVVAARRRRRGKITSR